MDPVFPILLRACASGFWFSDLLFLMYILLKIYDWITLTLEREKEVRLYFFFKIQNSIRSKSLFVLLISFFFECSQMLDKQESGFKIQTAGFINKLSQVVATVQSSIGFGKVPNANEDLEDSLEDSRPEGGWPCILHVTDVSQRLSLSPFPGNILKFYR